MSRSNGTRGSRATEAHRRGTTLLAGLIAVSAVVLLIAATALGALSSPTTSRAWESVWALSWVGFPIVGAVIAVRRPSTVIGWLLIGAGFAVGVGQFGWYLANVGQVPNGDGATTLGYLGRMMNPVELSGFMLLGLALLRFPHDRWPSRVWRRLALLLGSIAVVWPVSTALSPALGFEPGDGSIDLVANPLALPIVSGVADLASNVGPVGMLLTLAAGINLVWRGVRSEGVERQQMKWLAYVAGIFLVTIPLIIVVERLGVLVVVVGILVIPLFVLCFNGMAAAMGVAVLRYRLYDVDRVASRTATYAALTVVLASVYAVGVIGLGAVLRPLLGGGGSDLVVAASTLAVAALFAPLRRRIQAAMDRRFNRAGTDAARTVEAFTQQLRDEVDVDALSSRLRVVSAQVVQPASTSVWLR